MAMDCNKNRSCISIIIPAHNEEQVISKTLSPLLPEVINGKFEVIVVCNGCIDDTVSIVKSYFPEVLCIVTDISSKANALNLGDEAATCFPRIYLDADVVLLPEFALRVAQVLDEGAYLAASPAMKMSYTGASWAVKSYYKVWSQLPYVKEGMIGTGVYALSEQGRARFDSFPDIIADDGFVRALFTNGERFSVDDCYSLVRAPLHLRGLIKIKTRSRLGRYELALNFPELLGNEEKKYRNAIVGLLPKFTYWPNIVVYLFVNIFTRFLANKRMKHKGFIGWQRDDSSRRQSCC